MRSRRAVIAQIAIGLLALVAVAEGAATLRLTDDSHGPRHAFVGEFIQVGFHLVDRDVTSSDAAVVKPIAVTRGNPTVHYFLALLPGRSILSATSHGTWAVEIDVG